ncbi:DNA N6-methyl adenine demethylase-like isoform X2 [Xenia sp. Carnegie-2017]|uniref:DNA N6-methyl adenine demethylase-like isoform X2 n=1 Tax=Xenia sp. Carnegie-2017 TaxID=2897299 RepID=UPI001F03F54F|nr:DNA N6-methyl adenine demethylase-like isoform X2 [Xenia sp. Carnegie-2017]
MKRPLRTHNSRSGETVSETTMNNKKKRRRCGVCKPCLTKINCETCSNCLNRQTGHQICKLRKCIELKKKSKPDARKKAYTSNNLKRIKTKRSSTKNDVLSRDVKVKILHSSGKAANEYGVETLPGGKKKNYETPKYEQSAVEWKGIAGVEKSINATRTQTISLSSKNPDLWCSCNVSDEGSAVYKHLGTASSVSNVRILLAKRFNFPPESVRVEKVGESAKEGKNRYGCPIARWVLRRSSSEEKVLSIVRQRKGHSCDFTFIVIAIVLWDGVARNQADSLYVELKKTLNEHGEPTNRKCGTNKGKTCDCQGSDPTISGASFSFGCSWSRFLNRCKFAKSKSPRKFKLKTQEKEDSIDILLQNLASQVSETYKTAAPLAFENQSRNDVEGVECRLGNNNKNSLRPFSGITCCVDFCAHNHKDDHNVEDGATVVLTLLNEETRDNVNTEVDEQLHTLPCYHLLDDNDNIVPPNYILPNHLVTSPLKPVSNVAWCNTLEEQGTLKDSRDANECNTLEEQGTSKDSSDANECNTLQEQGTLKDSSNANECNTQEEQGTLKDSSNANESNTQEERGTLKDSNNANECNIQEERGTLKDSSNANECNTQEEQSTLKDSSNANESNTQEERGTLKDSINANNCLTSSPEIDLKWIDDSMGGVGLSLSHGSLLFECAKQEVHATTRVKEPNRISPTRISVVFYQHRLMNFKNHGYDDYRKLMEEKAALKAALNTDGDYHDAPNEPFDLRMLAETAINYPNSARNAVTDHSLGSHLAMPVNGSLTSSSSTSSNSQRQINTTSILSHLNPTSMERPNVLSKEQAISSGLQFTQYPLSNYLRSLKLRESVPYVHPYPTFPYLSELPSTQFMSPMFLPSQHHPIPTYNPFSPAGRSTFNVLNSQHLDGLAQTSDFDRTRTTKISVNDHELCQLKNDNLGNPISEIENIRGSSSNIDSKSSKFSNGFTVEALLGKKRSHVQDNSDNRPAKEGRFDNQLNLSTILKKQKDIHNRVLGLPLYPQLSMMHTTFNSRGLYPTKTIFTGTTTLGTDSLVNVVPYAATVMGCGHYQC